MSGHFPFGAPNGQQQQQGQPPQFTAAQLRAALTAASGMDESLFLQQHRQQQDFQRDLRLRQMLLQEQMGQQSALESLLQGQQFRGLGQHLHELPDLQQHYQSLLLNEQRQALARAQAQAQLHALQAPAAVPVASSGVAALAQAQAAAQAQLQLEQGQEEELQQAQQQAQPIMSEDVSRLRDLAVDSLAGNAVKKHAVAQEDRKAPGPREQEDVSPMTDDVTPPSIKRQAKEPKQSAKRGKSQVTTKVKKKKKSPSKDISTTPFDDDRKPASSKVAAKATKKSKTTPKPIAQKSGSKSAHKAKPTKIKSPKAASKSTTKKKKKLPKVTTKHAGTSHGIPSPQLASKLASLASETNEQGAMSPMTDGTSYRHGSLEGLIAAADAEDKADEAVFTLRSLKEVKGDIEWSDSESDYDVAPIQRTPAKKAKKKRQKISLPSGFTSEIPELPEEPFWEGDTDHEHVSGVAGFYADEKFSIESAAVEESVTASSDIAKAERKGGRVVSNVIEYPYAIDVWWPSVPSIRKERRLAGEESDEDAFVEETQPENELPPYRANAKKIRSRLAGKKNPGVLEKLPHCKIHRLLMKRKKNLSAPEMVYCWQVTETYPNDLMVCCSICGTWRHAACGGHHKAYSRRENTTCDFIPVCDLCHEEEKILRCFPRAEQRIERQRMEQLRRGLATSAVMRQAAFAKHGGTYKWPLGRVLPNKFGGHSRSVHARHDKAEKQWTDMANKLSRANGGRPKDRARVRTKELERLLVSVEDAEAHTDRHNMILFLMRDTAAEHPVGFEKVRRNVFDPEEDEAAKVPGAQVASAKSDPNGALGGDNNKNSSVPATAITDNSAEDGMDHKETENSVKKRPLKCSREGCPRKPRFDSSFCSDACGVSTLEKDLLLSLHDVSEIHPAVLRN